MKLFQRSRDLFLEVFFYLIKLVTSETEDLLFFSEDGIRIGLCEFEIIQPIENEIFMMINNKVIKYLAHVVVEEIDFFLTSKAINVSEPFDFLP